MNDRRTRRWLIAAPHAAGPADTRTVVLHADEPLSQHDVPFHEAMSADLERAAEIEVWLPPYRGKALVPVLAWLAAERLAGPDAQVSWHLDRQQGPDSIARMLSGRGWTQLEKKRNGRNVVLGSRPPAEADIPPPEEFAARIGDRDLTFEADYGVFSPKRIDDGTALLAEVAMREPPVDSVADIGVGYGPLAIAAVANGLAGSAVATDVDAVALWLAQRNAVRNGVTLSAVCSPDPLAVPMTELTLCNIPTHIDVKQTEALMTALTRRASHGRLLVVVHRSIEHRYVRPLEKARLQVERHPGPNHTVLRATAG
ncbi:methyltransferase [Paractinoplanes rishiriensis]|uniref:Methyltransferase small domain-containing protein n=1 Tax=Paractinoplanes rishiriensis TaxID=1050105 RepID=A0A919MTY3_9ACTN|nr:methyltransferase [Actinoplanes rishiriensis]GIE95228.1 hypothetical protein Ari01nite_26930 [Actinoplanes rishiriensis]